MSAFVTISTNIIGIVLIVSIIGLIYSFVKKKRKGVWIGLIIGSVILFFVVVIIYATTLVLSENKTPQISSNSGEPSIEGFNDLIDDGEGGTYSPSTGIEEPAPGSGKIKLYYGAYTVGKDIEAGKYDVKLIKDTGKVSMNKDMDESTVFVQEFGEHGIIKARVELIEGAELAVTKGDAIFTPSPDKKYEYEEITLYPGTWYVGEDITPGRYKILPLDDAVGTVFINDKDNIMVGKGKLGKGEEPPAINIDLLEGYRLRIIDMNFKLIPTTD